MQPVLGPELSRDGHLALAVQHHDDLPEAGSLYYIYYVIVVPNSSATLTTVKAATRREPDGFTASKESTQQD
jgi:hypothetical protein